MKRVYKFSIIGVFLACFSFYSTTLLAQFTGGEGSGYATSNPPPSLLPVVWGEMFGLCSGNSGAVMHWTTLQERNTSHFDVYRSYDGDYYEWVGRVDAAEESHSMIRYSFDDPFAFANSHPWVFYALFQFDQDESVNRLQTPLVIQNTCAALEPSHPVFVSSSGLHNSFKVQFKNRDINYNFSLWNTSGAMIEQGVIQDSFVFESLKPGVYFLKVNHDSFYETLKVVVY